MKKLMLSMLLFCSFSFANKYDKQLKELKTLSLKTEIKMYEKEKEHFDYLLKSKFSSSDKKAKKYRDKARALLDEHKKLENKVKIIEDTIDLIRSFNYTQNRIDYRKKQLKKED